MTVPAAHAKQMLLLKETEHGWLRLYTAEHRLVSGRFVRVLLREHYAGLPQPRQRRKEAFARQVFRPELSPAVAARPLSVYAQLVEVDHDCGPL